MRYKTYTGFQQVNNRLKYDVHFPSRHQRKTTYIFWEVCNNSYYGISFGKMTKNEFQEFKYIRDQKHLTLQIG